MDAEIKTTKTSPIQLLGSFDKILGFCQAYPKMIVGVIVVLVIIIVYLLIKDRVGSINPFSGKKEKNTGKKKSKEEKDHTGEIDRMCNDIKKMQGDSDDDDDDDDEE